MKEDPSKAGGSKAGACTAEKAAEDDLAKELANLTVNDVEKKNEDSKAEEEEVAGKAASGGDESDEDNLASEEDKKVEVEKESDKDKDDNEEEEEEEEEEKVIESVCTKTDSSSCGSDDDETNYTGKGPIQQRRVLSQVRANPYGTNEVNLNVSSEERLRQKMAAVSVSDTSSLGNLAQHQVPPPAAAAPAPLRQLGQFVDDPSVLSNILIVGAQPQEGMPAPTTPPATAGGHGTDSKTGIPALPDMNSMTKNSVGGPRIIIRGTPGPDGTCNAIVLPTPLAPTLDPGLRKLGIWLPRQALPVQALPLITVDNKLELLIQLDAKVPRVIQHLSSIGRGNDLMGKPGAVILNQFVELKPFTSCEPTGVDALLEGVDEADIESSLNLVNGKDLTDLLKTYGPNKDSMLMTLCCKPNELAVTRSQVFALVARILGEKERGNVVHKNASHLSALDYATVKNNRRIACFLAELYYVLGEDVSCPDNSGNTLLHVMARQGDVSKETLLSLLNLRLTHDVKRKVYSTDMHNNKLYLPIHHAAMSRRCRTVQNVIHILHCSMPACLTAQTDDGSAPIHLACQFTNDPAMIATLLHYKQDVVNTTRGDGFTPLHLVAARNDAMDRQIGLIPLDEETQVRMIKLLLDHGADRGIKVDCYVAFDLVKAERETARALLKIKRAPAPTPMNEVNGGSPNANKNNMVNGGGGLPGSPLDGLSLNSMQTPSPGGGQASPNVIGNYDPFIGGGIFDSGSSMTADSPQNAFGFLGSVGSGVDSDGGSNSDCGGDLDNIVVGGGPSGGSGSNNFGAAELLLGAEMTGNGVSGENDLDLIARLVNHPTIQAVMNGGPETGQQNNL